jgi:hypothetical protein
MHIFPGTTGEGLLNLKDLLAVFPPSLNVLFENEPVLRSLFCAESHQMPPFFDKNVLTNAENGGFSAPVFGERAKSGGFCQAVNGGPPPSSQGWSRCTAAPGSRLDAEATLRQTIEPSPEQAIDGDHDQRHHHSGGQQKIEVPAVGRLVDGRPRALGREDLPLELAVLRRDGGVAGAARGSDDFGETSPTTSVTHPVLVGDRPALPPSVDVKAKTGGWRPPLHHSCLLTPPFPFFRSSFIIQHSSFVFNLRTPQIEILDRKAGN